MMAALTAPIEIPATQSIIDPRSIERFEHADLIGAERAAALQHQRDLIGQGQSGRGTPGKIGIGHITILGLMLHRIKGVRTLS
jgi:hypothetical protein